MAINLAEKFSPKVMERFTLRSCTEGLATAKYEWSGVATVKVYTTDLLPLQTYNRALTSGSRFGALTEVGDTVQEMTVEDEKSMNGVIDKGNNTEQMQIKAASRIMKENTDNVIIPYVDKYRLQAMADGRGLNSGSSIATHTVQTWTKAGILEELMTAGAKMSNKLVPMDNRVCYISYTDAIKLKLADQVVGIDKLGAKTIVNGVIGAIDGMQIRIVPDTYMPTNSSSPVKFMIVRKGCVVFPEIIRTARILTDHPDVDGHAIQIRLTQDAFVLDTHKDGIILGV